MGPLSATDTPETARPDLPLKAAPAAQGRRKDAVQNETTGLSASGNGMGSAQAIGGDRIESLADALDQFIQTSQRDLHIQVHEGTGRVMVQVIAKSDGKVIREIPPEELLNLAARIDEMVGILFNGSA